MNRTPSKTRNGSFPGPSTQEPAPKTVPLSLRIESFDLGLNPRPILEAMKTNPFAKRFKDPLVATCCNTTDEAKYGSSVNMVDALSNKGRTYNKARFVVTS